MDIQPIIGIFHLHPKGFGFVTPEGDFPEDIFIPKHATKSATGGDKILCKITSRSSPKGPEGVVIEVIKRARDRVVCLVKEQLTKTKWLLFSPLLGSSKEIFAYQKKGQSFCEGDWIQVTITDWGEEGKSLTGEYEAHLGSVYDPSCDIPVAAEEFGLLERFPKPVLKQVRLFPKTVRKIDSTNREDFTEDEVFTIDPTTAKDYDDALSLRINESGNYLLGVHIADVSHYVTPLTPLDEEAYRRGNSTYFPGKCIPMLPEALSNELCSLKEKVRRLTVSVVIEISPTGDVVESRITRGVIKSQKRFTYEEAKQVLDGKKRSKHKKTLELMVKLCLILKARRMERGSVDLSLPEISIIVDSKGYPTGTEIHEYDITHQLVEEFMLKANEIVAKHFVDKGMNTIFRIHEEPLEQNQEDFFALARSLGFDLPSPPSIEDVHTLFSKARQSPFGQQISIAFIRSMRLAMYSHENVGHFGLALEHYCHFTSPIRRYSDLIVHRQLFIDQDEVDLPKIADHCSERERNSFKAEQHVLLLKKLRLLQKFKQDDPTRIYDGFITKIKPFGIYFELRAFAFSGFLHISSLGDDYFIFDPIHTELYGERSGIRFVSGTKIELSLVNVSLVSLEAQWNIIQKERSYRKKESSSKKDSERSSKRRPEFRRKRKR